MRELLYTILELEEWCSINARCDFCSSFENRDNKAVCQIRTRTKINGKLVSNDKACERCKEKFENNELLKCERCERLRIKDDISNGKYVCRCIERGENIEEKELPTLPHERESMTSFYERQINSLREELTAAEEALEIEREEVVKFQEKSEEWSKKQKQELLDRIKELEAEVERLRKLTSQQLTAQIEVKETKKWPWRLKK